MCWGSKKEINGSSATPEPWEQDDGEIQSHHVIVIETPNAPTHSILAIVVTLSTIRLLSSSRGPLPSLRSSDRRNKWSSVRLRLPL